MTNGQINFVHDLVQMAKAFEELPAVRAELEATKTYNDTLHETIQRLELRLIDLKTELDAAHEATRKAEVERDHAERMFLETDDRLNAFRRLVQAFDTDVRSLVAASEPQPAAAPESVTGKPWSDADAKATDANIPTDGFDPGPAIGDAFTEAVGERAVDPTIAPTPASLSDQSSEVTSASTAASTSTEGVSVPTDPTPATLDVQQAPASSFANAGENSATTESAGSTQHDEAAKPVDDTPGYHNEPQIIGSDWSAWDRWAERMNERYGLNNWPTRTLGII